VAAQTEVAKLSYLWLLEVKKRRSLQDEYDRPTISLEEECKKKFFDQPDLYQLSDHFLFQDPHSPMDRYGLEHDPVKWAKQLVPSLITITAKYV
jgi:hypothetical protein